MAEAVGLRHRPMELAADTVLPVVTEAVQVEVAVMEAEAEAMEEVAPVVAMVVRKAVEVTEEGVDMVETIVEHMEEEEVAAAAVVEEVVVMAAEVCSFDLLTFNLIRLFSIIAYPYLM